MKLIKATLILVLCALLFSGCQQRKQREQMQTLAEALASQQSQTQTTEQKNQSQISTNSLDSLRGFPLEETTTSNQSKSLSYNGGIALVIIIGLLFFGFMIFRFLKGAKKSLKDMSYIKSEASAKAEEVFNNPEMRAKMNKEEKQQLEDMLKMFDKN